MSRTPEFIDAETVDQLMSWPKIVAALTEGHKAPRAAIGDLLLRPKGEGQDGALLNRAAWIAGTGIGLKTVSVFKDNPARTPPLPTVQGVFVLFDAEHGQVRAVIDGAAITRWKTVGDSALAARLLARPDAQNLLIVGAGTIAGTLAKAYGEVFAGLERIAVWNRTPARAEALVADLAADPALAHKVCVAGADLGAEVAGADMIETATLSTTPVIQGAWLSPGTHLGLIGAYTPDMREADDAAIAKGRLFVDARETTIGEIGELIFPMQSGAIGEADVLGDFYDLVNGADGRRNDDDITVFKNGGGAHLDLMTAQAIWAAFAAGPDG